MKSFLSKQNLSVVQCERTVTLKFASMNLFIFCVVGFLDFGCGYNLRITFNYFLNFCAVIIEVMK